MQIIENLIQQSPEWFEIRKKRMTASHASEIGNNGKGLETYIISKMAEYYSSEPKEQISNKDTERGIECEPQARTIYEFETGNTVKEVGFVVYSEYVGASPDGLIYKDGKLVKGVEIKCHKPEVFLKLLLTGEVDSKYIWQVNMNMLVCGVDEWDYFAYCPQNTIKPYFIKTFHADKEKQQALLKGFAIGEKRIKEIIEKMEGK